MLTDKKILAVVIALTLVSVGSSLWMTASTNKALKKYTPAQDGQSGKLNLISDRLTKIEVKLKNAESKINEIKESQANLTEVAAKNKSSQSDDSLNEYLVSVNDAIYQLEGVLDASGLLSIATNDAVDASVLGELYSEQIDRKKREVYRTAMTATAKKQKENDISLYGTAIKELAAAATFRMGRRGAEGGEEREAAVTELLEKYPDSYAAGQVLAEQGMMSAMRGSLEDTEEAYQKLKANDKYMDVVHDRMGAKIVPNIQNNLAEKYIAEGRYDDAEAVIAEMEVNNEDYVWGGRRGVSQTVAEAAKKLRDKINK